MPTTRIDGVQVKPLKVIADERGRLFEILRRDDPIFTQFGQAYCTTVDFGVVKGWHLHKRQIDNFVCVSGMIKLALYDGREGSPTRGMVNEFFLGVHQPQLVQIPALVHHGFKGISPEEALKRHLAKVPMGRFAAPEEVASVAVFLAVVGLTLRTDVCVSTRGTLTLAALLISPYSRFHGGIPV